MRKYLDDIGILDRPDTGNLKDKRQEKWKKERELYGFDERETWSLDYSFHLWLYERLKYFLDFVPVNLEHTVFSYKGNVYSLKQMIEMMIKRLEFSFSEKYNVCDNEQYQYVLEIEKIWAMVVSYMWW